MTRVLVAIFVHFLQMWQSRPPNKSAKNLGKNLFLLKQIVFFLLDKVRYLLSYVTLAKSRKINGQLSFSGSGKSLFLTKQKRKQEFCIGRRQKKDFSGKTITSSTKYLLADKDINVLNNNDREKDENWSQLITIASEVCSIGQIQRSIFVN